jgi:hypothetical protein
MATAPQIAFTLAGYASVAGKVTGPIKADAATIKITISDIDRSANEGI